MRTDFPDSHRDLLDARFATLATLGRDGGPQLTEIWFLFEDGKVKTSFVYRDITVPKEQACR